MTGSFVIKLNSGLYFYGEIEGDSCFTTGKRHAVKFDTLEELAKVIDKYGIEGYAVGDGK